MTMKAKTISMTLPALDADGIAAAQQLAGAGDLTLNGALVSGGTYTGTYAHQIGMFSSGNIATVVFTVYGTDQDGATTTDTITGINNTTVETTKYFKTVTRIAADAAVGTDVIAGTVDEIATNAIPLDIYTAAHTFSVDVTGTLNYDMEVTFARMTNGEAAVWVNDADIAGETASQFKDTSVKFGAVRIVVNSYTAGATIKFRISPEWK